MIVIAYVNEVTKPSWPGPIWSVQLEGHPRISHYASEREANETAVCAALESVSRHVGRGEISVANGLTVQVIIQRGGP